MKESLACIFAEIQVIREYIRDNCSDFPNFNTLKTMLPLRRSGFWTTLGLGSIYIQIELCKFARLSFASQLRQKTICQGEGERVPSRFVLFSSTLVPIDLRRMGTFVHVASSVDPSEDNAFMGNRNHC